MSTEEILAVALILLGLLAVIAKHERDKTPRMFKYLARLLVELIEDSTAGELKREDALVQLTAIRNLVVAIRFRSSGSDAISDECSAALSTEHSRILSLSPGSKVKTELGFVFGEIAEFDPASRQVTLRINDWDASRSSTLIAPRCLFPWKPLHRGERVYLFECRNFGMDRRIVGLACLPAFFRYERKQIEDPEAE